MTNFEFDPELLQRAGVALFGEEHWRAGLADVLRVSPRTARAWAAGKMIVPAAAYRDLHILIAARLGELQALHTELSLALRQAEARAAATKFAIGDLVEGGEGEDHDVGKVIAYLDPPVGECDVEVAWDSGVRTPAIAAELRKR